jgi:hypothetical protein
MLIYFMVIWNIVQNYGIFYDHLVHFGIMYIQWKIWQTCAPVKATTGRILSCVYTKHEFCVVHMSKFVLYVRSK